MFSGGGFPGVFSGSGFRGSILQKTMQNALFFFLKTLKIDMHTAVENRSREWFFLGVWGSPIIAGKIEFSLAGDPLVAFSRGPAEGVFQEKVGFST